MLKFHSNQLVCNSRTPVALIVTYTILESSFFRGNLCKLLAFLPTCRGLIQLCLVLRHPFLEQSKAWGHCQGRRRPWHGLHLHGLHFTLHFYPHVGVSSSLALCWGTHSWSTPRFGDTVADLGMGFTFMAAVAFLSWIWNTGLVHND